MAVACGLMTSAQNVSYSLQTSAKVDYNELHKGFELTPNEARLRCYWWWLNSMATKESITWDLEQMKANGYGGASIVDAGSSDYTVAKKTKAGPVFMSPAWMELYKYAVKEAQRIGIELSVNVQSGWNPGGPTITPELALKKLVYSETKIAGGKQVQVTLPQPEMKLLYKDILVQAFGNQQRTFPWRIKASNFGGSSHLMKVSEPRELIRYINFAMNILVLINLPGFKKLRSIT